MYEILLYYLIIINVITFIIFSLDKYFAISHKFRIKNKTLLALSIIGGSIGGILSMYIIRHKTKQNIFRIGIPLILIIQIFIILKYF